MSTHGDLFFDAVDSSVVFVKDEPRLENLGGSAEQAGARRRREGGAIGVASSMGQQQTPVVAAPPPAPAPAPPPPPPITASELRLAASAALRLAVEAIDALHGLKEVVFEMAEDVRELLEATRRAGGVGGRRRRSVSMPRRSSGGGHGLGVRTRAQARRWR